MTRKNYSSCIVPFLLFLSLCFTFTSHLWIVGRGIFLSTHNFTVVPATIGALKPPCPIMHKCQGVDISFIFSAMGLVGCCLALGFFFGFRVWKGIHYSQVNLRANGINFVWSAIAFCVVLSTTAKPDLFDVCNVRHNCEVQLANSTLVAEYAVWAFNYSAASVSITQGSFAVQIPQEIAPAFREWLLNYLSVSHSIYFGFFCCSFFTSLAAWALYLKGGIRRFVAIPDETQNLIAEDERDSTT